jgi:hypothetical protein
MDQVLILLIFVMAGLTGLYIVLLDYLFLTSKIMTGGAPDESLSWRIVDYLRNSWFTR